MRSRDQWPMWSHMTVLSRGCNNELHPRHFAEEKSHKMAHYAFHSGTAVLPLRSLEVCYRSRKQKCAFLPIPPRELSGKAVVTFCMRGINFECLH